MAKKRASAGRKKVDSIELLAQLVADGFAQVDERFEQLETVLDDFHRDTRSHFAMLERNLERIETRIAALEFAVFGADASKRKSTTPTWFSRIERLEKAVFKK